MTTQYRFGPLEQIMIKQINEIWKAFWRTANNWALMMDPDPFEDIYGRLRRLEAAASLQSAKGREPIAAPDLKHSWE
jgi:hypothetical protein